MSLLSHITGPTDLKGLPVETLRALAQEIRALLIEKVCGLGGHLGPNLVDPRWIAPVDQASLKLAQAYRLLLTVEETTTTGAPGARIAQALAANGADTCAGTFALPPRFLPHASRDQILHAHGLDGTGIAIAVLKRLSTTHRGKATAKEFS